MKQKKIDKKMSFKKQSIANLSQNEMRKGLGGGFPNTGRTCDCVTSPFRTCPDTLFCPPTLAC